MKVIVTGSRGLIGFEAVEYYYREGHQVVGVDNNRRAEFFGFQGDTSWNLNRLKDISILLKIFSITVLICAIASVFLNYSRLIPLI